MIKYALAIMMIGCASLCSANDSDIMRAQKALSFVQKQLNQANTYKMVFREETKGQTIQNIIYIKKHDSSFISCRHEMKFISGKKSTKPVLIRLVYFNKAYILPVGVGNIAVRLKFEEIKKINLVANLFMNDGEIKLLQDTPSYLNIRYTCTAAERQKMLNSIPKTLRLRVYDSIPSIYQYKIDKKNGMLRELICFTSRGKLVKRILFDEITVNCEIENAIFKVPKRFKILTANSFDDLKKIQVNLQKRSKKSHR